MNKELFVIARKEKISLKDVVTILRFSLILDKNKNLREYHIGASVAKLWIDIPNKKYLLEIYKDQIRRESRNKKRRKMI